MKEKWRIIRRKFPSRFSNKRNDIQMKKLAINCAFTKKRERGKSIFNLPNVGVLSGGVKVANVTAQSFRRFTKHGSFERLYSFVFDSFGRSVQEPSNFVSFTSCW